MTKHGLTIAERFWSKVEKGPSCWLWKAGKTGSGYGSFGIASGKMEPAPRIAYALENGPVPQGLCVLHKCDNPLCVNPDHLYLGTHADNVRDRHRRNRHRTLKGEAHPMAKLTAAKVERIRIAYDAGESGVSLTRKFGVAKTTISAIINRKIWR